MKQTTGLPSSNEIRPNTTAGDTAQSHSHPILTPVYTILRGVYHKFDNPFQIPNVANSWACGLTMMLPQPGLIA